MWDIINSMVLKGMVCKEQKRKQVSQDERCGSWRRQGIWISNTFLKKQQDQQKRKTVFWFDEASRERQMVISKSSSSLVQVTGQLDASYLQQEDPSEIKFVAKIESLALDRWRNLSCLFDIHETSRRSWLKKSRDNKRDLN